MATMNSYRSLLLELSNSLTISDLQELKFLCGDVIPAGSAERITKGFELFGALEQRNMLSEENRDFLASKLIAIKRIDLRNKLLGIQGKNLLKQVNIFLSKSRPRLPRCFQVICSKTYFILVQKGR